MYTHIAWPHYIKYLPCHLMVLLLPLLRSGHAEMGFGAWHAHKTQNKTCQRTGKEKACSRELDKKTHHMFW